jgi:hypothetical protein
VPDDARVPDMNGFPKRAGFPIPVRDGAIAQLGERLNGIQEVVGSIPIGSTKVRFPPNSYEGEHGRWHDEISAGKDRPETDVTG